jgi:hypothetical protein
VTYLEPPTQEGDDETTIVFTQNMNRIVTTIDNALPESDEQKQSNQNENTTTGTTQAYRHGRCHLCDKPVTIANLNPTVVFTCTDCTQIKEEQDDPEYQHQEHVLLSTITIILNQGYG